VEAGLAPAAAGADLKDYIHRALMLEQEKLVVLSDAPGLVDFFLQEDFAHDPEAVEKVLKKEGAAAVLRRVHFAFSKLDGLTAENTEKVCRDDATANGIKTGQVFHPVRVSVSGRTKGPSLFHMLEVMGKDRVLKRMDRTIASLSH
jgi:glutamyl/glutaminyl-tRNA synthetase